MGCTPTVKRSQGLLQRVAVAYTLLMLEEVEGSAEQRPLHLPKGLSIGVMEVTSPFCSKLQVLCAFGFAHS